MKFSEIMRKENTHSIAFLLTGVEANFVLFVLDVILSGERLTNPLPPGCAEYLADARTKIKRQLLGHQFIDWKSFKAYAHSIGPTVVAVEEMERFIENLYNGGASPSQPGLGGD